MPKAGKKPGLASIQNEENSNVVFGDVSKPKKTRNGKATTDRGGDVASKQSIEEAPNKPDTRKLIGGASWTGKLPVNLLSEHCQKQKWLKPEYTMSKTPDGFSSMVVLKVINPKTKETVSLPPFQLPPSCKHIAIQPTAVEARHFAATYALFRVCSMRNVHMMLPPTYRDLWKKFQDLKAEDVKEGKGWMYEADPFAAKQERDEAQILMAKKREERENQKIKEAEQPANVLAAHGVVGGNTNRKVFQGWTKVPKIDMDKHIRASVEDIVRRNALWNPHGVVLSEVQRRSIVHELTDLGFRRSHVIEAVDECKDRDETLEWLLIYVPEEDLPRWSLPENYVAGVSLASGNLKREASIKKLAETGYSSEACASAFDEYGGNESLAAEALQNTLLGVTDSLASKDIANLNLSDDADADMTWMEEAETLSAIYGERFTQVTPIIYHVQLQLYQSRCPFVLRITKTPSYPRKPPVVSLLSQVPAYIRLSAIRQLIEHANAELLGDPMIFNLVDWLENEIPRIEEDPGKLRDVSVAPSIRRETLSPRHQNRGFSRKRPHQIEWNPGSPQSLDLFRRWQAKQDTPQQRKMLSIRQSLPAWKLQDAVVKAVKDNQVTIISGETGSGKSTQAVQFVLDDLLQRQLGASANIVCTQPRRLSALSLADRVSEERCSTVGDEVGYAIRGESKQKAGITKINFVTTGVLLRRLQSSGGRKDDVVAALADLSHVVVDEVHERSLDTDFLLVLLRDVLKNRTDLRVILMSATLDAGVFENYFNATCTVARIEIQGRTFPVHDYYLDDVIQLTGFGAGSQDGTMDGSDSEDGNQSISRTIQEIGMNINYNLIASTVRAIDSQLGSQEGGILIFLPGTLEIHRTLDAIRGMPHMYALPLHASLLPAEQRRVFPAAPRGKRKVIAATNVAETSITIDDIVAVIDCGKVKETSFDPQNNMVKLEEAWASRAACKQRRGRAGRVQAGKCYRLYTRNAEAKMAERPEPEIRRVPLEQLCLSVRAMGVVDVPAFLGSALTPPETLAVEGAMGLLGRMNALDGGELTALGRHLSMIPADLRCGKLMVYGATFGCLEACLTIAAILTVKSPFVSPQTKREESKAARLSFAPGQGDLICDLRAYEAWSQIRETFGYRDTRHWCEPNYLSHQTLADISSNRSQYLSSLQEAGFLPPTYPKNMQASSLNASNANTTLIRALIAGAFNPQLARIDLPDKKFAPSMSGAVELDPEARTIKFFNQDNGRVFVHPSSTLFGAQTFTNNSVYLSYFNKMATSKTFIRELAPCNAYSLLLFSGPISVDTLGRGLIVDGWLRLRGWARIGVLVSRLRMMLDELLKRKIEDPGIDLRGNEVVGVVRRLVELDGLDR